MKLDAVIEELKSMGDPRAIKVWAKLNMDTSGYLGVGLTKIKKLGKKIKKNHSLSEQLWNTGIRDARLLSFTIADAKELSKQQIIEKVKELDFWDLTDNFCSYLVAKSQFGAELAEEWRYSDTEMIKRCAFISVSGLAKSNSDLQNEFFESYLNQIGKEIKTSQNWVKESMIIATMSIGVRNANLYEKAVATSEKYGEIVVDYGDTSCITPNAYNYLRSERAKAKVAV